MDVDRGRYRMFAWLLASILLWWGCPTAPVGGDDDDAADDDSGDDDAGDDDTGDDDTGDDDTGDDDTADDDTADAEPPLHGSSGGSGGETCPTGCIQAVSDVEYILVVPFSYSGSPTPLLLAYSGTEGASTMTNNLLQLAPHMGLGDAIVLVLDGVIYNGDGGAGALALEDVRYHYDVDNDRTYLLSESAGTTAGLELGFSLRQSYFAAFWANDVNAQASPVHTADQLGFAPWGNAGPGGDFEDANAIVGAMNDAGYRLEADSPYTGPGASQHGSTQQFMAALGFFAGKSRL